MTPLDESFALSKVFTDINPYITSEESKANAQLIAAAPELLEALQGMLFKFGNERHGEDEIMQAIQAINKALNN